MRRDRAAVGLCCALLVLFTAAPVTARQVCQPIDAAFAGSVTVGLGSASRPLNELTGAPLGATERTYQFTSNGVTFLFQSLSTQPLSFGTGGISSWSFGPGQGLSLTVNPPVAGLGVRSFEIDGCPGATYAG